MATVLGCRMALKLWRIISSHLGGILYPLGLLRVDGIEGRSQGSELSYVRARLDSIESKTKTKILGEV
jgi:hypothetical protein